MKQLSFSFSLVFIFALIVLAALLIYPPRALAVHVCRPDPSCLKSAQSKAEVQKCQDAAKIRCSRRQPTPQRNSAPSRPPKEQQVSRPGGISGSSVTFMQLRCTTARTKDECERPLTSSELNMSDFEARRRGREVCHWVEASGKCTLVNLEKERCAQKKSLGCVWLLIGGSQNGSCVDSKSGYKQNDICSTAGFDSPAFSMGDVPRANNRQTRERMRAGGDNMSKQLVLLREQLRDSVLPGLSRLEARAAVRKQQINDSSLATELARLKKQIEALQERLRLLQS